MNGYHQLMGLLLSLSGEALPFSVSLSSSDCVISTHLLRGSANVPPGPGKELHRALRSLFGFIRLYSDGSFYRTALSLHPTPNIEREPL